MTRTDRLSHEIVEHLPRLRRFCRALTPSVSDADDLCQAAVERGLRNLERYEDGTRLDRWLIRIAQNLWADEWRTSRRRATYVEVDTLADLAGEDGNETVEARRRTEVVRQAVATLPEDYRAVIALVVLEEFSYREAAEILAIPIGTIMSRLSRARQTLGSLLAAERPA